MSTPLPHAITFGDLFEGLGTLRLAYRPEASALDGRDVAMTGFVVPAHGPARRDLLVETPGACPDCRPVPVAAVALEWLATRPAAAGAVVVQGRLSVGFALAYGAEPAAVGFLRKHRRGATRLNAATLSSLGVCPPASAAEHSARGE